MQPNQQAPMPAGPEKSNKLKVIFIAIAVTFAAMCVLAVVLLVSRDDSPEVTSDSSSTAQEAADIVSETTPAASTVDENPITTSTYIVAPSSFIPEGYTISLSHPESWQTVESTDEFDMPVLDITSQQGNSLELTTPSVGIGGDCSGVVEYTVLYRLKPQVADMIIAEVKTEVISNPSDPSSVGSQQTQLISYDRSGGLAQIMFDTSTGSQQQSDCELLALELTGTSTHLALENSSGQQLTGEEIEADPEFKSMIQSLSLEE